MTLTQSNSPCIENGLIKNEDEYDGEVGEVGEDDENWSTKGSKG